MIFDIMFYVSLTSMWVTTLAAAFDPTLQQHPTLMIFVSMLFGVFTAVFYHMKADSK